MADTVDKESKTEEATEKKILDSIEKGNTPFSREASVFASMTGILVIAGFIAADGVVRVGVALGRFLDNPGIWRLQTGADAVELLRIVSDAAGRFLLPCAAVLVIAGFSASVLQNPPSLVLDRVRPKLSRISPKSGWERIFGAHGQADFVKALFKFAAVSLVVLVMLQARQFDVLNAMFAEPSTVPGLMLGLAVRLLASLCAATVALAAADLVWSRFIWRRDLRMSRQEVKDEYKQIDGDPIVKARMRSLARDRSRRRMMAAVPRATFVIANPTHYAVALRFVRAEQEAPLVLAKGRDLIALKIREIAETNEIPVIEDKPLARALHDAVEVDTSIPPAFYEPVAKIVHFLQSKAHYRNETVRRTP